MNFTWISNKTQESGSSSPSISGVRSVKGGIYYTAFLTDTGDLYTFGSNDTGQLGDSRNVGTTTPNPDHVLEMSGVISIGCGLNYLAVVKSDNTLWTCGSNTYGQLGDSRSGYSSTLTQVATDVKAVACGDGHLLAIKTDDTLWACGLNQRGQLGLATNAGTTTANPTLTQVTTGVKSVTCGTEHTLVIKSDDTLWTCGNGAFGRLARGGFTASNTTNATLTQVTTGVLAAAGGKEHTLVLKSDNTVWACGRNRYGACGKSTGVGAETGNTSTLTKITSGISNNATAVSAGFYHSAVLLSTESILTFGQNWSGQLGRSAGAGTTSGQWTPTSIQTGVAAMVAYGGVVFTRKTDDTFWNWGSNLRGELGDTGRNLGVDTYNYTPTQFTL